MGSRWTWRLLALPGVLWLSVFFLVAFYAVIAVAFGNQNTLSEPVPFWNPLDWNVGYMPATLENIWNGEQFLTVFVRTYLFRRDLPHPVAPHRVSRRLLRGAARRPVQGPRPRAADPPVLDQLPDADARMGQPARARWSRNANAASLGIERLFIFAEPPLLRGGLARRPTVHRDHGADLRLPPVPDPAPLRRPRPDRPAADRGGA